ncbi:hypothetical protein D1646_19020 [Pseudoflavonifractor sp. 60]|mgnify:CR=1 FL=1|uniref:ABC transporter permease subunit n=1 Tax=Pseudoflavonifractor sp. 60 TaxID=2304576 RepID=UPI00136C7B72|nr:ABC transporter permease subunit [Pseudoflavonifractor sp. 60]MCI8437609.1 ABC transporter permease subunit [Lawsonibacter sp.]NBI68837.1 hypothetical protein [Pseudoflavonifractor sp. 60]
MTNLLSAALFRLKKSRLFWCALLLCAAAGAWQPYQTHLEFERRFPLDSVFFVYAMLIGLLLAVFLPLFFGVEYSDGTLRNKLATGHARLSIYLSSLTVSILSAFLFCGGYILCTLAVGVPLLGQPKAPGPLLISVLLSLLMEAAWCSIFTLFTMNFSRKAASAVSCILLFLAIFAAAMTVYQVLEAPEFYPSFQLVNGEMVSEMVRNPNYITEERRPFYQFLLDLNPVGQAVQYTDGTVTRPLQMALCSLGIIAGTTVAGVLLFKQKDLK